MSNVYDCWERLVAATLKQEEFRRLALCPSINSVYSSESSSRFSFDDGHPRGLTELSFEELKEKTCNFALKAMIGEGPRGCVYLALLNNGKKAAVRVLESGLSGLELSIHVSELSRLKHENLVEFLGHYSKDGFHLLAYEYGTMGSLEDILHRGKQAFSPVLNWKQRVRIAVDIVRALDYLHNKAGPPAIHFNVKSSNVLLFEGYKAKIVDLLPHPSYSYPPLTISDDLYYFRRPSVPSHLPPEYSMGVEYLTQKSDIYSFGVVLLELLTGRKHVDDNRPSGERDLVTWSTPRLGGNRVRKIIDPKLNGEYPRKGAAKLAAVAGFCLENEKMHRLDTSTSLLLQSLLSDVEYS